MNFLHHLILFTNKISTDIEKFKYIQSSIVYTFDVVPPCEHLLRIIEIPDITVYKKADPQLYMYNSSEIVEYTTYIDNLIDSIEKYAELNCIFYEGNEEEKMELLRNTLEIYFTCFHKDKPRIEVAIELTAIYHFIMIAKKPLYFKPFIKIDSNEDKDIADRNQKFFSEVIKRDLLFDDRYIELKQRIEPNKFSYIINNLVYLVNEIRHERFNKYRNKSTQYITLENTIQSFSRYLDKFCNKAVIPLIKMIESYHTICSIMDINTCKVRDHVGTLLIKMFNKSSSLLVEKKSNKEK